MITAIEPEFYSEPGDYDAYVPIFTIRGRNLDKLPDEVLLCSAASNSDLDENIDWENLGSFYTLIVLNRSDNEIQFCRTSPVTGRLRPVIPYYLTTPHQPPRSIIHKFNINTRGLILEEEK